jgi:DNA-binding FadR family transcriptional regulator
MNQTLKETLEAMLAAIDKNDPDAYFDAFERLLAIHKEALKK